MCQVVFRWEQILELLCFSFLPHPHCLAIRGQQNNLLFKIICVT